MQLGENLTVLVIERGRFCWVQFRSTGFWLKTLKRFAQAYGSEFAGFLRIAVDFLERSLDE
ncbi:Uncharacterised protein [Burkholderia pseudomallei]|nr:Uncharacterised protein [Burkholderia pseudomallei]CAJ4630398.1 Uncharacterised protein [Burkholderia pseudomallei]CAJ4794400.1 Uncharacterised protein [Burkholderia pseudomallei]CAJ5322491.1 Uncharacterised protein [Burkholderia pseudomallei]CAJ5996158.1 Uncharacterised protein [Burkholderia pseudomallei]